MGLLLCPQFQSSEVGLFRCLVLETGRRVTMVLPAAGSPEIRYLSTYLDLG